MSRPAVTMPDPEREVITALASLGAGVVSTDYPSTSLTCTARRVQVDFEGGSAEDYPVTERAQVRVVCHRPAGKRTTVKADADEVRRLLYVHPGGAAVAAFRPGGRSAVSTDPDTGNVMCWVLVQVDLKAAQSA